MKRTSFVLALVSIVSLGILPACRHSSGNSSADDVATPPHDVFPPEITVQSTSITVQQGQAARLTVKASPGKNDKGTISYQWFETDAGGTSENKIPSETNSVFNASTEKIGTRHYFCLAASSTDPEKLTAKSRTASVTVTEKPSGGDTPTQPEQPGQGTGDIDFDFSRAASGGTK